jgi:hypothetical protein
MNLATEGEVAAAAPSPLAGRARTPLEATAQLLTFAPGLYAVDFVVSRSAITDAGLRLPCARLEPVPAGPGQTGRCFVSIMAEAGWLSQSDQPTFVRAVGGTAGVMLTIYTVAGDIAPPEIRIRRIQADAPGFAAPAAAVPTPAVTTAVNGAPDVVPLLQLVHVQTVGDVQAGTEQWAGRPGSGRQVEGFGVTIPTTQPPHELKPEHLEYQAIMGEQWNTPWARGGAFCGSRGMGLPLLGFRFRLIGPHAENYVCTYWGSFANKGIAGPIRAGAACESDGAVLEALRIVITRRGEVVGETALPAQEGGTAIPPGVPAKTGGKPRRPGRDK